MAIRRVAVIFDNQVRPDTTGIYCRRALGQLVEVEHFLPIELARVPREGFDLYLFIDDGLEYPLRSDLHPSAWWAIDTHLNPEWCRERAGNFDFVFAAQRDGAELLRQAGHASASWLPLACDPEFHRKQDGPKAFDVSFVGHLFPGPRSELVQQIKGRFRNTFIGQKFFDEMARIYSASRLVFNRSIRNDVNMRVFEALACGSLLMTNDLGDNGQDELFRDGVHLATYRDGDELLDKIRFYLDREELRERLADAGRAEALSRHTYRHRMQAILDSVAARLSTATVPTPSAAPTLPLPAGQRARDNEPGLTSILIVTHNQLAYTRLCLDSIRTRTDEPYELIVIDNASSDGTVGYLRAQNDVRMVTNEVNRGFPAAVNQGIALARGEQILLLNNDVVMTTGWLRRLLRVLRGDPKIGLTGPCSNFVSGPQQVASHYESLAELDGFAWDWGKAHDGRRVDVDRLVGFCLLIRRSVVEAVGLLDEQFGLGCFEDDDYCLRAIKAGYRAVIAGDAFVHHFGGRTFVGSGVDFGALMRENERRFRAKWSKENDGATPTTPDRAVAGGGTLGPFELTVAPGDGLLVRRRRIRLSLCMIVRDSARTLPACLESIRPWVDEMVIVDTGSIDETPRIVESFGGRLFHFPWCDDFSAARNESLRHARGDWLFWMDSDDTIPPECGRQLRSLIDGDLDPTLLGFVMQVHCPGEGEGGDRESDVTVVDHVKLFRNRPDLKFDGRIHEQILPAIRRAGGDVAWTDLHVVHSGSDASPAAQERKRQRDLRILERELAERPDHPFTLFNLGMTLVDGGRFAEAADYLRRSIARSGPEESHLRKAYALLLYAEMRLEDRGRAWETCRRARELFPQDAELRFREGVLLHDLGRLEEARRAYLDVLENREERHFTSVDRALTGFKARQNLAVVAVDLGDLADAERQWRAVVREAPHYRTGWRGLGEILMRLGRLDEARALAEGLVRDDMLSVEGALLKHRVALAQGRLQEARIELGRAASEHPDDLETLRSLCQFFFEHGTPNEAEPALRQLIARDSEDASAHHNLGTLLLRSCRVEEAEQAYRQSLRYRSNHPATYLQLGYALKQGGRIAEAAAAWEQVLRLAPGHPVASAELHRMNVEVRSGARAVSAPRT
jgi:O-antigen biosynthesis protein